MAAARRRIVIAGDGVAAEVHALAAPRDGAREGHRPLAVAPVVQRVVEVLGVLGVAVARAALDVAVVIRLAHRRVEDRRVLERSAISFSNTAQQ